VAAVSAAEAVEDPDPYPVVCIEDSGVRVVATDKPSPV